MELTCNRSDLLSACQLASAATTTRSPLTILSSLKAVAKGNSLLLTATDCEAGIRANVAAIVEQDGDTAIPAAKLISILREIPDDDVRLASNGSKCHVVAGFSEFNIQTEPLEKFPDFPAFPEGECHKIQAGVLRNMLRLTSFAAADQDTKYAISGSLWEFVDKKLSIVATDTRRLGLAHGKATESAVFDKSVSHIVPNKSNTMIERILDKDDEIISVCLQKNDIMVKSERAELYSRLLEGRYPPYKDIIPKKPELKILIKIGPFLSALRQVVIMTEFDRKKASFAFCDRKLVLKAVGGSAGDAKIEMPIEHAGAGMTLFFDPKHLIDLCRVLDPEKSIIAELVNPNKPAVFRYGDDYLHLVMTLSEEKT